ncbi:allophanate hydrolase subunit 1 [Alteromonas sp. KUL49]|uniref:5-oxoprolinase subunit B family protein n=1 Tax=Alteromonas sp. KUL49 TaxID=2480798 RepID=UPI00102ED93C|nr:allophanate hydrolase subunit 1 [Alteromonas sp. KUL49]TAP40626.1 allophanate hydrolase subunit 1 [Alteromonas sp. KUL49]GEA10787.1 allophanate hydrolase [Alteromonas sp. KUL49]
MRPFGYVSGIAPAGINGLILYFSGATSVEQNQRVSQFVSAVKNASPPWVSEILPSYNSLLIVFDVIQVDSHYVYQFLSNMVVDDNSQHRHAKHHKLPVWYNAPKASDFDIISAQTGLSFDTIISLHSGCAYQVFAVGFVPGFGYLGDTPEPLACPRLSTPRVKVPQGAVAIADRQTAVYPSVSPGGWNLLGLCPASLTFADINGEDDSRTLSLQALLSVGDTVEFYPITEQEYQAYCDD